MILACSAYDARESFKGIAIDQIISSPLSRAYRTAEIVAEYYKVPIQTEASLKEASWGDIEGQPRANEDMFTQWRQGMQLEGGESFEAVKVRVKSLLDQHLSHEKSVPLFVSHGGVYWAILELLDLPYSDAINCQIVYFSPVGNGINKWVCGIL